MFSTSHVSSFEFKVRAAVENAKTEGVREAYSMGLSNFSQKIFRRMGFTQRASIAYHDYKQVGVTIYYTVLSLMDLIKEDKLVFDLSQMGEHSSGVLFTCSL